MDRYKETFQTWNKIADVYEQTFMDLEIYNSSYNLFCKLIEDKQPKLLELGCGPGNISKYILSKLPNSDILGTDIAANMISLAQKNNPSAQFKVMDCREISALPYKFNGIIGGFCLPYLSPSDYQKLVLDCRNLLSENGILYLSFVDGHEEDSGYLTGSSGDRVFFHYHSWNSIASELLDTGFSIEKRLDVEYLKRDATIEIHTVVIARKLIK